MRPDYCRNFHCHWLNEPSFGDIWKPSVSKFVMNYEDQNRFAIVCDPGHPTAWSREPYGPILRKLAAGLLAEGRYMLVYAGATKHIVLPSHDVPVGRRDEDRIFSIRKRIAGGEETYIVDFDDAA
jgi:hypothetical protein